MIWPSVLYAFTCHPGAEAHTLTPVTIRMLQEGASDSACCHTDRMCSGRYSRRICRILRMTMNALKYPKVPFRDVSEPSADSMWSQCRTLNHIDEIVEYLALTKQMSPTRKSWNTNIHYTDVWLKILKRQGTIANPEPVPSNFSATFRHCLRRSERF